jgi:E3 ubiquitin-protein ligase MYCBP2
MSPSVAESIRAVFAAFVWHSGIVQDTLACAAFLKFNSGLTKQGSGGSNSEALAGGTRQMPTDAPTARQRHSVEVIYNTYLNYKENDWVDRLSGGNANRNVILNNGGAVGSWDFREAAGGGALQQHPIPEHEECEGELRSRRGLSAAGGVSGLPPTLAQLVMLWEGTVLSCMDAILAHSCGPPPPPAAAWSKGGGGRVAAYKNLKNNREATGGGPVVSAASGAGLFSCALPQQQNSGNPVIERPRDGGGGIKESQQQLGGGVCDNWLCDICGGYFEPPVTYHMRAAHPGCGAHAGGKGYNSGGQYCGGWAGNCGDGGIGGSSWYLICERCKERHRRKYKAATARSGGGGEGPPQRFNPVSLSAMLASFSYASATSPVGPLDYHVVMKANSMFLLDLASSGGEGDASRRQLVAPELETVSELIAGMILPTIPLWVRVPTCIYNCTV